MEQSKKITDCANQQVWTIANAIGKGNLGRWRLLVNAGIKYAPAGYENEEQTVPGWMLPGSPGNRGFPDKPDICLIVGLDIDAAPPSTPEERSKYTLVFLEVATGHDHYLQETCNMKRSKYVELVCALRTQGWQVKLDINQPFHDWFLNYKYASEDSTDRTDQSGTITKKRVFRDIRPDIEEGEIFAGRHPGAVTILLATQLAKRLAALRCNFKRAESNTAPPEKRISPKTLSLAKPPAARS